MTEVNKILNMSEEEQWLWCQEEAGWKIGESIADLAFRLEHEAARHRSKKYHAALLDVWHYYCQERGPNTPSTFTYSGWVEMWAKPIDKILAAIRAKEAGNGKD